MDLIKLRHETRHDHESVEGMVPLMDAGLTRSQYREVLQAMFGVVRAWESWAAANAPVALAGMVRERRRSEMIEADLQFLGSDTGAAAAMAATREELLQQRFDGVAGEDFEAAFLGSMYVMEGSTLGGQYIARHVEETLGFEPGVGDRYFRGYGEATGAMWNSFKQVLGALPDTQTDCVIDAAKAMFGYFGEAMQLAPTGVGQGA